MFVIIEQPYLYLFILFYFILPHKCSHTGQNNLWVCQKVLNNDLIIDIHLLWTQDSIQNQFLLKYPLVMNQVTGMWCLSPFTILLNQLSRFTILLHISEFQCSSVPVPVFKRSFQYKQSFLFNHIQECLE